MFDTKIPVYGIMILLSLIANIAVVAYISRKYSFTRKEILCLLLYENVAIVGGAKLLAFLENYEAMGGQFDLFRVGLSAYGAAIGALLSLILFCVQFKKPFKEGLAIFMPSIPLMYAIGKIGCFLAGCCYGIAYSGFGSVVYNYSGSAPAHMHLFPVQIVETIFFVAIFVYLMVQHIRNQFHLATVGIGFVLCGAAKFLLEFLRDSHTDQVFSSTQAISTAFILIGVGLLYGQSMKIQSAEA